PKPGLYRTRRPLEVIVELRSDELTAVGRVPARQPGEPVVEVRRTLPGPFTPAKDAVALAATAREAFDKLGPTGLQLAAFRFQNPDGCFVPVSRLNQLRRDLVADIEEALRREQAERIARLQAETSPPKGGAARSPAFQWSIKVDRIGFLDALEDSDLAGVE